MLTSFVRVETFVTHCSCYVSYVVYAQASRSKKLDESAHRVMCRGIIIVHVCLRACMRMCACPQNRRRCISMRAI